MQLRDALRNSGLKATSNRSLKKKKKKLDIDALMEQWNRDPDPIPTHRLRKANEEESD